MKRILTFMFITIFAFAFSVGFTACKKKDAEVTEEKKVEQVNPAGEEKKEESKTTTKTKN